MGKFRVKICIKEDSSPVVMTDFFVDYTNVTELEKFTSKLINLINSNESERTIS